MHAPAAILPAQRHVQHHVKGHEALATARRPIDHGQAIARDERFDKVSAGGAELDLVEGNEIEAACFPLAIGPARLGFIPRSLPSVTLLCPPVFAAEHVRRIRATVRLFSVLAALPRAVRATFASAGHVAALPGLKRLSMRAMAANK